MRKIGKIILVLGVILVVAVLIVGRGRDAGAPNVDNTDDNKSDVQEGDSTLKKIEEISGVTGLEVGLPENVDGEYLVVGPVSYIKWFAGPYEGAVFDKEYRVFFDNGKVGDGTYVKLNLGSIKVTNSGIKDDEKAEIESFIKSPRLYNIGARPISVFEVDSIKKTRKDEYLIGGTVKVADKEYPRSIKMKFANKDGVIYGLGSMDIEADMFAGDYKDSQFADLVDDAVVEFYIEMAPKVAPQQDQADAQADGQAESVEN